MAIPTLVQKAVFITTGGQESSVPEYYFPNPTLSGNTILIGMAHQDQYTLTGVSDDATSTYSLLKSQDDAGNTYVGKIFTALNIAAGITLVDLNFTGTGFGGEFVCIEISEWANLVTASIADGAGAGALGSTAAMAPGTITTSVDGDLIYVIGFNSQGTRGVTDFTPSGGYTMLSKQTTPPDSTTNNTTCFASMYKVQTKANSGGEAPSITAVGATFGWLSLAVALKAA